MKHDNFSATHDLNTVIASPEQPAPAAPEQALVRPLSTPVLDPPAAPVRTPVALDHPRAVDTATLEGAGQTVKLYGITGIGGAPADGLSGFIASGSGLVTCQPRDAGEYTCLLANGIDVASAAVRNGAAQTRADSPPSYHDQELLAQSERLGIWASLPPQPVILKHPGASDTATLLADRKVYQLDGIQGVAGDDARSLAGYIAANGDQLLCQQQGGAGRFVCLMSDGTDVAKVALVNGAARVAPDAPDSYRAQQARAIAERRGIWRYSEAPADQPQVVETVVETAVPGLDYADGTPVVVIGGQTAFLVYVDGPGWGYWDAGHQWAPAPPTYVTYLQQQHPEGAGLRGYAPRPPGTGQHVAPGANPPASAAPVVPIQHQASQAQPQVPSSGAPVVPSPSPAKPAGQAPAVTPAAGQKLLPPATAVPAVRPNNTASPAPAAPQRTAIPAATPPRPVPPFIAPHMQPQAQRPVAQPFHPPPAPAMRAPMLAPRPAPARVCVKGKC